MKISHKIAIGSAALTGSMAAMADTAAFTSALTSATGDVATYGAGLVTLALAGVGFGIAVKFVKKLRGAA